MDDIQKSSGVAEMLAAGAGIAGPVKGGDGREYLVLPEGYSAELISEDQPLPAYPKALRTFDEPGSLVVYAKRFSGAASVLLADIDSYSIACRLDYHENGDKPGHDQHTAKLVLRQSEEFARWNRCAGRMLPQAEFAAFLEENAVDVTEPDGADLLELARDLEATRDVQFKSSIRLDNGDRQFQYADDTKPKGNIAVPQAFKITIPIFQGDDPITLQARLRYRISEGGLTLGYEWHRTEYVKQAKFREIAAFIAEETGLPWMMGR